MPTKSTSLSAQEQQRQNLRQEPMLALLKAAVWAFESPSALNRHIAGAHLEQEVKCPHSGCGKEYTEKSTLNQHIKIKHLDVKLDCPYDDCPKVFEHTVRNYE